MSDQVNGLLNMSPGALRAGRTLVAVTALCAMTAVCGCGDADAPETPATQGAAGKGAAPATQPTSAPAAVPVRVRVAVVMPGGSAEHIEQDITVKIEAAVMALEGAGEVRSVSREGVSEVDVEFAPGVGADAGVDAVRRGVHGVAAALPAETEEPLVTLMDTGPLVASITVYGDLSSVALHAVVDSLRDRIKSVVGVARVELIAEKREVRIEVSPENLRRFGLTLDVVRKAIRSSSGWGAKALGEVVVGRGDGSSIRLADIARISQHTDSETVVTVDGKNGALMHVHARQDQDPAVVVRGVRAAVAAYRSRVVEGVQVDVHDCSPAGREMAALLRVTADCPGLPAEAVEARVSKALASILRQAKGVKSVCTVSSFGRSVAQVAFRPVTVLPMAIRRAGNELASRRDDIGVPPGGLTVEPIPSMSIGRFEAFGGTSEDDRLKKIERLRQALLVMNGVVRVDPPVSGPTKPVCELVMKRQAIAALGLTEKDVADSVRSSLHGQDAAIESASERLRIVTPRGRDGVGDVDRLTIPAGGGRQVPLSEVVEVKMTLQRAAITRVDGRRCMTLGLFGNNVHAARRAAEWARSLAAKATDESGAGDRIEVRFHSSLQPLP